MAQRLVIYDSAYGNTEQIAQTISNVLGGEVTTLRVNAVKPEQLTNIDLLIIGSPTQRFRPTPAIGDLLRGIPRGGLRGVKVAAFDTRLPQSVIDQYGVLAFFVRFFGYAAEKIAARLKRKGGDLVVPPEGFIVDGTEGPLQAGELERATDWAKQLVAAR